MTTSRSIDKWDLHAVYTTKYSRWTDLEAAIASIEGTTEKGDAFEQFCYFYFVYFSDLYDVEEVWCDKVRGKEIPDVIRKKLRLEKTDYGVDGVNLLKSGQIEAWQAKFHSDRSSATYGELATFWSESEYADRRRTIANARSLPNIADKKLNHSQTLLDKLLQLDEQFFDRLHDFAKEKELMIGPERFEPRPYQKAMIEDVVQGLQVEDRGKLIAACGTGKTLVSMWIVEDPRMATSRVLFLAPSIALIAQTLKSWASHRSAPFNYLCVCSDRSVADSTGEEDEFDTRVDELDFRVTTNSAEVVEWLRTTSGTRQYVFSTYQSVDVVREALAQLVDYRFDLVVFDEAHRTVGLSSHPFASALSDSNIPARKRLFMTATERLVAPRLRFLAGEEGREVVSMSDPTVYGRVLHEYNFGMAINDGVIADYEILLAELSDESRDDVASGRLAELQLGTNGEQPLLLNAESLFKESFLIRALQQEMVTKTITFHSSRSRAKDFANGLGLLADGTGSPEVTNVFVALVLGNQSASERAERVADFEGAQRGVLCNVRCLSEGVDIPIVDSIYLVDPKNSLIELVQAIGRALRKQPGISTPKLSRIIVPVRIAGEVSSVNDVKWDESFATFHSVIQAMRDQDKRLSDLVSELNLYAASGGTQGRRLTTEGRIRFVPAALRIGKQVALDQFLAAITLRVARVNANPQGARTGYSTLGKGERKSEYEPVFSILGDYNPNKYEESLVVPTLAAFPTLKSAVSREDLAVNHNNVSHCERLGLIWNVGGKTYQLSRLGRMLKEKQLSFQQVFRNQMLLYSENGLFSYRLVLQLLLELDYLNHVEFLYGPYIMPATGGDEPGVQEIVRRVKAIRTRYPNPDITSLDNRDRVRADLNALSPVDIPDKEVWGDRSTPKNKFRYLKSALGLFDFVRGGDSGFRDPLAIEISAKAQIESILAASNPANAPREESYGLWYWGEGIV